MKLRNSASLAAIGAALFGAALMATPAQAQKYDKVVVFGDSLSDNGNLALFGAAPPPPYSDGRFSNGDVWTQQLGFGELNGFGNVSGSTDFAFGGAETGAQTLPPGLETQFGAYLQDGGSFDKHTLVTLWAGANDIFDNLLPASVSPDPLGYIQNIGGTAAGTDAVVAGLMSSAGAGTILIPNLPQLSATPEFSASPAAPLADAGQEAFNAILLQQVGVEAKAHPTTNFIIMDVAKSNAVIHEAPGLFGFTNVTASCFNGVSVCATPNTYLYWDGVHPTAAGHHLLAELAMEYIYYGNLGAPTSAEIESSMRHRTQTLDTAIDQLDHAKFTAGAPAVGVVYDHDGISGDARDGGVMPSVNDRADSVRFLFDDPVSEGFRWGGQVSATRSQVGAGMLNFRDITYAVDGYGGWRADGGFFVNAAGGFGIDEFNDINRQTMVGPLVNTANTTGYTAGAKVQTGWYFGGDGFTVSPRVGVTYDHGDVDGYTEQGLMVSETIANRSADAISAEATIRLDAHMGDRLGAYFEAGYRDYVSYNADKVTVNLAGNTSLPLSTDTGKPEGGVALIDAGVRAAVTDHIDVQLGYRGQRSGSFNSDMGQLAVKWRF
ncbi:MAG TPA: autotransporter domain-containing protein [Caulobacteraceae bacterium]|jgi:outer membrane lipase/esterase|nr:autotransporter domain-containing protein [Caulobacteraceae bacterium]